MPLPSAFPLQPWFSPRLWGTRDLSAYYPGRGIEAEPIGEAWLSAAPCRLAGDGVATLGGLMNSRRDFLLGPRAAAEFPLLAKFLFPRERLSVQVHPDDAYAAAHGLGRGKTEMWHIVAAEPGAELAIGLNAGVTLTAFAEACRAGRGAEALHWIPVHPGETYFLPAGTIHALGGGLVICEIQQQSDNTFRLDDYGRRDAQGRLRELHLDHGLAVARPELGGRAPTRPLGDGVELLVECPYFRTERCRLTATQMLPIPSGQMHLLVALEEGSEVAAPGEAPRPLPQAQAVILPAGGPGWSLRGSAQVLLATVPQVA